MIEENSEDVDESFDNVDSGEDDYKVDTLSNLSDEPDDRSENEEDEWLQAQRRKDASEVLWLGS